MNTTGDIFPAKILLFGEYTILLGSSALSIPYNRFSAELKLPPETEAESQKRIVTGNKHLFTFFDFLQSSGENLTELFDFDKFYNDLKQGLYFYSTIPAGYGLGSSGALVAAIFNRYAKHPPVQDELLTGEGLLKLKKTFSEMESFFHGRSSGFDPLVCFLKKPLFLKSDGMPQIIGFPDSFSEDNAGIFLLDTGQTGKTAPLVRWFLERFKQANRITEEGAALAGLVNNLVNSFLASDNTTFLKRIKELSVIQVKEFKSMIPEKFISLWEEGIESGVFYLKLCGSGGGGYLIGFSQNLQYALNYLKKQDYSLYEVNI